MKKATACPCCGSKDIFGIPAILMPFVSYRVTGDAPFQITDRWGLHTIDKGFQYTRCDSMTCSVCGMVFAEQRFSNTEMKKLYQGYRGSEYSRVREAFEPGYRARVAKEYPFDPDYVKSVEEFIGFTPKNALDWGGGNGLTTPFRGKTSVAVYELDKEVKLLDGVGKMEYFESYDLVTCSNVLEHVPYPTKVLADMLFMMDLKGKMFIEVPYDPRMEVGYINKRHWHEHINMFTIQSLEIMFRKYGDLKVIKQRVVEVPSGHQLQMLLEYV